MKKYLFLVLASVILFITSCSPFYVRSDYSEIANFNQYKTYKLRIDDLKLNDIDKDRVLNELSKQLKTRGMTISDNPDLIVNIKAQYKKIIDIQNSPGMWGWGMNRTWSTNYNQGGLVIDIVDANTQKLVWQGIGDGIYVDSPKSKQKQIPNIINEIMANYPPKK